MADERQTLANSERHPDSPPARQRSRRKPLCPCNTFLLSKICLMIYAIFLLIIGAILIGVGAWAENIRQKNAAVNTFLSSPSALLIVVGCLIVIIALVGAFSTLLEKFIGIKVFLILLILIFLFEIVVGVVAFVYREEAADIVGEHLRFAIDEYGKDDDITDALDKMQEEMNCCGFILYKDWERNEFYSCNATGDVACGVPSSCCTEQALAKSGDKCGWKVRDANGNIDPGTVINVKGCAYAFISWIEDNLDVIGAIALGFAIPQVIGIFLAYNFMIMVDDRRHLYKSTYI
ncbi:tetraspanin-15 [Lingula anatina]|uniref:Tetraspanin n=1 Tax=Lingula anatina TaxID=7574 RepID=A0A1S3I1N5_LINAN|nr:tetraspanin-15 [Lingula anatina]|eukprot:XP_013392158.1 tetraspanin-15 [Lingula anatina]